MSHVFSTREERGVVPCAVGLGLEHMDISWRNAEIGVFFMIRQMKLNPSRKLEEADEEVQTALPTFRQL